MGHSIESGTKKEETMNTRKAFTLIELLIVVAIIAILAAIAVPNFLEAQTRAKVSRVRSDMRAIATALESYSVDYNKYPYDFQFSFFNVPVGSPGRLTDWYVDALRMVTTPVAYMTTLRLPDPFFTHQETAVGEPGPTRSFKYYNTGYGPEKNTQLCWGNAVSVGEPADFPLPQGGYILGSYGPDRAYNGGEWASAGMTFVKDGTIGIDRLYDPTNGTVSAGDLIRTGGGVAVIP